MGILQASKNACQLVQIEPNEVIFQSNQLLFESSQKDFQNVGQNNYSLITEIVKIPNRFEGRLISSLIIESINIGSKFGKLFCQLIKHQDYFINCIRDINFYGDGNEQFDFSNSFTVNLPIDQAEVGEEFFHQNFVEFLIFCFDNNYLKIHSINIENNESLKYEFQIIYQLDDKCRKKYFQKDLNYFFIAFYQCSFWGIVSIKDYLISDILNKYSFQNFVNVSETNIYNVQFCNQQKYSQIGLYLIIENGYFELIIDDQQVVQNYLQFYEQDVKFREIIFGQYCQIVLNIIHLQSSNKTKIQQESFSDEFEGTPLDIQLFYEALFVQYQNELLVIYNKYFRQNIKINDSHFVFYDKFNLIQQVDQISKQIYIYKFSFPRNILKPSKQYIYLTSSQFRSQIQTVDCIEVKKVVPQTFGQFKIIIFENQCQKQVDFLYSKAGLYNQQDLKEFYQNETLLKISDRITIKNKKFEQFTYVLFLFQRITALHFKIRQQLSYIKLFFNKLYQNKHRYFSNIIQFNGHDNYILILKSYRTSAKREKIFQIYQHQWIKQDSIRMKVKSQVLRMIQFQELLLVFTQDYQDSCIMNIKFARVFFYEDMFKILYQIFYQEILEKDKIENDQTEAFFYQQNNPSFIQYQQQIIAIRNKKYNTYKTNNIQIIILKLMIKDFYYFLGLHLYNNDIIEHYFDLEQISIFNNYTLLGYELIRPLKYEIQNQYLAIGIKNGSDKFIQVFEIYFTKPFKLVNNNSSSKIINYFFMI
ncbi:unnamed protein product [Paramecium sonneborni]|uniref:Uncharacterized protein n=1 Tax=Paramecium sonneborni TaxID=65129 RepID=A0A8S1MS13_9CILI|nr:unnamed protein product [Paramecium sonneborni]